MTMSKTALAYTATTILVLLALVTTYRAHTLEPRPNSQGCDTKRPIPVTAAIVIDRTDTLSAGQRKQIQREVQSWLKSLPSNSLVAVFGIQEDGTGVLSPGFCRCRPADGDSANPLIQSNKLMLQQYLTEFLKPCLADVAQATTPHHSPRSPILEALFSLSNNPSLKTPGALKSILLVSDMLQNSSALSFYDTPPYPTLLTGPLLQPLLPDLTGARVHILQLERPRDAARQGLALQIFWKTYFKNAGVPKDAIAYDELPAATYEGGK